MNLSLKPLTAAIIASLASTATLADTLRGIYELAVQNDAKLKAAEASYKANLETEQQALSTLLPQLNASASYQDTNGDNTSVISGAGDTDSESETYAISLQQQVFDLPAWFSFKSGQSLTAQAEAQFAADQQNLIIRTAEAYFNVLRSLDNLEASKAEEKATQQQLEQTQQRFDVGLIAITDVHEARAVYDGTVVQRLTDEGNVGTSYEALQVLTGQSHADLWLLNKDFPVSNPNPVARDQWVDFALANNYQLKAAMAGAQASHQNAQSKKMEHLPKLTASYSYSSFDEDGSFDSLSDGYSTTGTDSEEGVFGLSLNMPLYSGGRISSQRRQAFEQFNAARETEIDTRRTVVQATRSLHITVLNDVQRVNARQQAIVSTRSALEATQAGYEVGTRNIVDVLQARRALFASIRDYANSRYDYVVNLLRLKQQAGTLSPQDIYDLNKWLVSADSPDARQYDLLQ
jgi:outer membrane protein